MSAFEEVSSHAVIGMRLLLSVVGETLRW
jgi:hypothetical protein